MGHIINQALNQLVKNSLLVALFISCTSSSHDPYKGPDKEREAFDAIYLNRNLGKCLNPLRTIPIYIKLKNKTIEKLVFKDTLSAKEEKCAKREFDKIDFPYFENPIEFDASFGPFK